VLKSSGVDSAEPI